MERLERRAQEAMARLGRRKPRERIPDDVRACVLEYAEAARADGRSWAEIGETVGLSASAIVRWRTEEGRRRRRDQGRVVPVEIVDEAVSASSTLVLVTGPYRLEGLDAADAAEVLRRLAV